MVATVLRLRYRILANTLARRPWQLVGFVFGILWALWILGMAVAGLIALSLLQGLDVARAVATIGGSLLLLGWVIGPLLIAGLETTVDAGRLAPFPLSTPQVMRALVATGITGIPGLVTALVSLSTVVLWLRWPVAAAVAVPCIVIAVLLCVVATQLMSSLARGLGGNRRGREVIGTVVLALVVLAGPILTGVFALIDQAVDLGVRIAQVVDILAWTPLGAAWAVPGDLAAGEGLTALARFAIAAATLVALWLLWQRSLDSSVTSPPQRASRAAKPGALGLFGRMPTGGVGATWARSLTAWLRDPRYLRQLLVIPLFPVVFVFAGGVDGWLFSASAVMCALVLSIAGYADVSYDGTAFASVLSTGIRGRADRLGRLCAAACIGIPLTVLVGIVTAAVGDAWQTLPAVLGAALGLLLAGYGVTAVSSALLVVPVARPGDSPFKTVPVQTLLNGLIVFVVWGACLVLATPAIVLAVLSLVSNRETLGWISLLVAIVVGAGAIVAGVVVGGRTIERTGPDLLARIKAFPT